LADFGSLAQKGSGGSAAAPTEDGADARPVRHALLDGT